MKVTVYSNFLNHHQIPFCNEMYQLLGDDFKFVACESVPQERIDLGYQSEFSNIPYLIESQKDDVSYQQALSLGLSSDVVITGSASEVFIEKRLQLNQLTFRYSERLLKKGIKYLFHPKAWMKRLALDTRYRKKQLYMLSSSAFTPKDYGYFFAYPNKFYKWGYFPEVKQHDTKSLMINKNVARTELLWVGRMIDWKRPFIAIKAIKSLVDEGFDVHLSMVGTGLMFDEIKTYIMSNNLDKHVTLTGSVLPSEVRTYMEKAHIFIITSTKEEGWGAVVNEAMNSGCVVLSYYKVGSAPYLIHHFENGILYHALKDLTRKLKYVISNTELQKMIGLNAYQTMDTLWNPKIAAERLLNLSESLLQHKQIIYDNGPISIADKIHEKSVLKKMLLIDKKHDLDEMG